MDYKVTPENIAANIRTIVVDPTPESLKGLIPPYGLTLSEVLLLPIPAKDRHWALVKACGIPSAILYQHACWCARYAVEKVTGYLDPRILSSLSVAERFSVGEATEEELKAANDAVWEARRQIENGYNIARLSRLFEGIIRVTELGKGANVAFSVCSWVSVALAAEKQAYEAFLSDLTSRIS